MPIIRRKGVRRRDVKLADPETTQVIAELSRDVDEINDKAVPMLVRYVTNSTYTEPFDLALPYNPDFILLGSVRETRDPERAPVLSGGMVEYFWRGDHAEIRSIDGLTPSAVRYSFKFLIVGKHDPENG